MIDTTKYLMVRVSTGVVTAVVVGMPDRKAGYDYVSTATPGLEIVGVGFARQPDGTFVPPPTPVEPVNSSETIDDLLAQIDALRQKVEAITGEAG